LSVLFFIIFIILFTLFNISIDLIIPKNLFGIFSDWPDNISSINFINVHDDVFIENFNFEIVDKLIKQIIIIKEKKK
jgi:hypothetical protein